MTPIPELTDEQRRAALEKASKARREKAELLRALKHRETTLASALDDPRAERIKAEALVRALPGYGKSRAAGLMHDLGIAPSRRVKGLGVRQRRALLDAFGEVAR